MLTKIYITLQSILFHTFQHSASKWEHCNEYSVFVKLVRREVQNTCSIHNTTYGSYLINSDIYAVYFY